MIFEKEKVETFLSLFAAAQPKIAAFPGCSEVILLKDADHPEVLFTYSTWDSAEHLEKYRNSELFHSTWTETKKLFAGKPEAWTVEKIA